MGITAAAAGGTVQLPSSHVQTLTKLWRSFPFLGYVNTAQAALNLQKELVKYLEQQENKRRMWTVGFELTNQFMILP